MQTSKSFVLFLMFFILAGCTSPPVQSVHDSTLIRETDSEEETQNAKTNELLIWTPDNIFSNSLEGFQEKFPDALINIKEIDPNIIAEKYRDSLIKGKTPDIYVFPIDKIGGFSGVHGLEDLSKPMYDDSLFMQALPKGLVEEFRTSDSNKLFALPLLYFPYVTYYRADILKKYGFPSEPDRLSEWISDKEKWIEMAEVLKQKGHYITETDHQIIETALRTSNLFNGTYDYIAKKNAFGKALEGAVEVEENDLDPSLNIWEESGKAALKNDELVMFYMANYVQDQLKEWVPDQKENWGITTLPFGLNGVDRKASTAIAISSQSQNKMIAWEFIKHMCKDMMNIYKGFNKDPFYINKDINRIYWNSVTNSIAGQPTILDKGSENIWKVALAEFRNGEEITEHAIEQVHQDIGDLIRQDQKALQNLINKN